MSRLASRSPRSEQPTSAGRTLVSGVVVITAAKVWFILTGYAIYFGLTRLLGPERFGLYAIVISIVSVFNNVLIAASVQTVSRFVARHPNRPEAVLRQGLRVQVAVGLSIFLGLQAAAPQVGRWFSDPDLVLPLRVVSAIVFAYALYAAYVGYLNGRRRFRSQAVLDATYSTLKLACVLGAVALGFGVVGGVAGMVTAAFTILVISHFVVGRTGATAGGFEARQFLNFGGWLLGLTVLANLVLTVDLWVVKGMADPQVANQQAGLYRAAMTLAQLQYQMIIPLVMVVFPNLARLAAGKERGEAQEILRGALRYIAVTLIPAATLLGILGGDLVALLYSEAYRTGGEWLRFLAPAYAVWTALYLLGNALAGAGRPEHGVIVVGIGLTAQIIACVVFYPMYGPIGVALGDLVGLGVGLVAGLTIVSARFGNVIPYASVTRGAILAIALGLAAYWWSATGLMVLVKMAVLAALGAGLLILVGEIRMDTLRSFLGRRGSAA